jgi:hypothetical protein
MNVLTEATIAIMALHVTILMVHLIAFANQDTQEMALIVKVSPGYFTC